MHPYYARVAAVWFEPTPLRTGAWSQRLRPLGQTVLGEIVLQAIESMGKAPLGGPPGLSQG